jgi:flagellar hook-associated protein 1 FlgK
VDSAGNHSLAFRAAEAGYANVSVQNYTGPANGTANALLNINIEGGALYTSDNNLNGTEGSGILGNGYPAEKITLTQAPLQAGLQAKTYTVFNDIHSSAKVLAGQLSNIPGVEANAFTYALISDFNLSGNTPLQIALNGKDLLEYRTDGMTGEKVLSPTVPDPVADLTAFNDYLAEAINNEADFKKLGITAVSGQNPLTGAFELRVTSAQGDDLNFSLIAGVGQSIAVSDGEHNPVDLRGRGNDDPSQILVGGLMDVRLSADMTLNTQPSVSLLFGDTQAEDFQVSTYLGLNVTLSGAAKIGDRFTIDFNHNAASDNRNALGLIGLESQRILNGGTASITDAYGTLVETVGISTSAAKINSEAAEAVLEQTTKLRDSISGVNLDEEAANLIRYEQFFQANAQVITVARNLFDTLINSF